MIPKLSEDEKSKELRDWDLWGPLLFCLSLALILSISGNSSVPEEDYSTLIFGIVFVLV